MTDPAALGALFVGIAAILGAFSAIRANRKSSEAVDTANAALAASPSAVLEGLRSEVAEVIKTYTAATERWATERHGMAETTTRERQRADQAEAVVLALRGELATMRIDLAAARADVADLRLRFETAMAARQPTT